MEILIVSRLCAALLISLVLHAVVLMMPVRPFLNISSDGLVGVDKGLQVRLLPAVPLAGGLQSDFARDSGGMRFSQEAGKKRGIPAVPVFVEARLVSDISLHIDDPAAFGFVILCVEIDADGVIMATSVLHSDFSPEVAASVEREFAGARFKPAELNGERQGAKLLFRVDVD